MTTHYTATEKYDIFNELIANNNLDDNDIQQYNYNETTSNKDSEMFSDIDDQSLTPNDMDLKFENNYNQKHRRNPIKNITNKIKEHKMISTKTTVDAYDWTQMFYILFLVIFVGCSLFVLFAINLGFNIRYYILLDQKSSTELQNQQKINEYYKHYILPSLIVLCCFVFIIAILHSTESTKIVTIIWLDFNINLFKYLYWFLLAILIAFTITMDKHYSQSKTYILISIILNSIFMLISGKKAFDAIKNIKSNRHFKAAGYDKL